MAHYIVTGAAGFIGARTSELLLKAGHTVVGIDNMNDAYDPRVKEYRLKKLQSIPGFSFHKLDISNKLVIEPFKDQKFDGLINLAARAGVRASVKDPWVYVESNMIGTLNMLEICRQTGTKKFIVASTSSIYGEDPPYPTPESASSSEPLQPYAASKKGAEAMCHAYHHLYGNGEQSRGFTYIDDIAHGVIAALKPLDYEVINLGGHEVITINNLIKLIEDIVGKKAIVEYGPPDLADMRSNWADVSKAGELLGWKPQYDMRAGIQKLVEWYNAEREWASKILT